MGPMRSWDLLKIKLNNERVKLLDKANVKNKIMELWGKVNRPGVMDLITFLCYSDFFIAPCSTEFHLAVPGGLAEHSLNVYNLLLEKINYYSGDKDWPCSLETIIICALGHDLCKANFYKPSTKTLKVDGRWIEKSCYICKDELPLGHGEKSVSILQDFIKLTDEEKLAIRWHMCAFDASIHFNYSNGFVYREACKKSPLVTLLFTADFEASNIVEAE